MRKLFACLLLFLILTNPALASSGFSFPEANGGEVNDAIAKTVPVRFLPGNPLYLFIILKEDAARFFKPSSLKKGEFDLVLSGKRIKEAYLLLQKGDIKNSSSALVAYQKRLTVMIDQLEKARGQNQDVTLLVSEIADGMRNHEILLFVISTKLTSNGDKYSFKRNFESASSEFMTVVLAIDNIKPGLKDRFRSATSSAAVSKPETVPSASPLPESSSEAKPKRIIY